MPVRLEPVFLANVLLCVEDNSVTTMFPFVSRRCHLAMHILKVNPWMFDESPHTILKFIPNINTIVVESLSLIGQADTLPNTVTSIVVKFLTFYDLTETELNCADRVVEIQNSVCASDDTLDLRAFPKLERLHLINWCPRTIRSDHKLKTVWFQHHQKFNPPGNLFEWAERVVVVLRTKEAFLRTKQRLFPPHVHIFCSDIGENVAPEDFYPDWSVGRIILSDRFGLAQLRAFNERSPNLNRKVSIASRRSCAECDVSFLTGIQTLQVRGFVGCSLTIPTTVVSLVLKYDVRDVFVSGTENLTSLEVPNDTITTTESPKLQKLKWSGKTLSTKVFSNGDTSSLSAMTITAHDADPLLTFPVGLTTLCLYVTEEPFDVARLAPLTRLQQLDIAVVNDDPVDLSMLDSVVQLITNETSVRQLPTSLTRCEIVREDDFDFSALTNLTVLVLWLQSDVHVVFPTQLGTLVIKEGQLGSSNIADVALRQFQSESDIPLTPDTLTALPKTITRIKGTLQ